MIITKELHNKDTDQILSRIGDTLRVLHYIDPVNIGIEKREFFRRWLDGKSYNPQFRYPKIDVGLEKIEHELGALKINTGSTMGRILEKKRQRLLLRTVLLAHRGHPRFLLTGYELYGRPSTLLVSHAIRTLEKLKNKQREHKRTVSSKRAVLIFKQTLARHRIDWRVREKRGLAAKAGISSKKNILVVRKGAWFSRKEIERLIAHEIETHIFRVENGRLQPYSIFSQGFPGPETTEEGLAVWGEFRCVKKDYERRRIIAARTLGVEYAIHCPFFEAFERLMRFGLHPDSVWDVCVRAKRGLEDTSRKGAFTKDYHYLKGYLEVKQYHAEGKNLRDLYVGRINIYNVGRLARLANIVPPKFLPGYLRKG